MSTLANDREVQNLMREFLMCCNRSDNAEAKGVEYGALDALHEQRRTAASRVEEVLLARGWVPPLTTGASPVRLPETAHR